MKKFQNIKTLQKSKLTKEQMFQKKGGMRPQTGSTRSICHVDGVDDGDGDFLCC